MKKLLLPFFLITVLSVKAQTLLVEDFNYSAGQDLTANGWTAHGGAGAQPVKVNTGSLSLPGYYPSGGNAALLDPTAGTTAEDVNKTFTAVTGGTVYTSFLVNFSAIPVEGYFFHLGGNPIGTAFRGRVFAKDNGSGQLNFGLAVAGTTGSTAYASGNYNLNTPYLFVLKYNIVTGTNNDEVSLYIFDAAPPATEPATPNVGPLTDATQTDINPASVALRQYDATQNIIVDGIKIGTSWADGPLPVTLIRFEGFPQGKHVKLSWATAAEEDNSHFEIERSQDGQSFVKAGEVKGNNQAGQYTFTDDRAANGTNYYRLKQVDRNGKFAYSDMVAVKAYRSDAFKVFSNAQGNATAAIYAADAQLCTISVYDLSGEQLLSQQSMLKAGPNEVELNTAGLASGVFIIKVKTAKGEESQKYVK